jgi:uncharacterized protein YndB with AHSA1/START domain
MSIGKPIVVEQTFSAPTERVWRAITDRAQMSRWFFEQIKDFQPERGFETTFVVHADGKDYPHHWKVTEVVPGQRLVNDWLHPGIPGAAVVEWDLSKAGDGSRLKLTFTEVASFPQDNPAFTRESCQGGWEYFFARLKGFVENEKS